MILIQDVPSIVLNLPIIISFIAATRYLIGFKTWKNYPVVALSLAYYFFFSLLDSHLVAITLWLSFAILTIGVATVTRYFIRKIKVNYYARIAIIYLAATVAGLIGIAVTNATALGPVVSDTLFGVAIFLIGSTIDDLAALQFKKDTQEFLRRFATTLILGLISGLLLSSPWWNGILSRHQEILLFVLALDVVIAFWSALRLTELIRFNSIIGNKK
jgi:hypothetical protein